MNAVLKNLIQYQELCFTLSEHEATLSKGGLKRLETSLQRMREKIPNEVGMHLDLLRQRTPLFIAPVVRNACSACRQSLPTSLGYSIRTADSLHRCPGCSRILYLDEDTIRQTGKRVAPLLGGATSGVTKFSDVSLMIPQLAAKTRDEAIAELAQLVAAQGYLDDAKTLAAMAREREKLASTAVEKGVAFPHVRGIEGGGLTLAMGMKRGGLDFSSPDGVKTKLVFFAIIPTAASDFYLKVLGALNQVFRDAKARNAMLACKSADDMWETLQELTADTLG